jgi:hypothetical protein
MRTALAAVVLASMASLAGADEPVDRSSSPMDGTRLASMLDAIAAAPSMTVEHTVSRKAPVEFPTRLPLIIVPVNFRLH